MPSTPGIVKADPAVIDIVARSAMDESGLTLPGTLDRAAYVAVNRFLEFAGARWDRKAKRHLFGPDTRAKIDRLLDEGGLLDEKKHFQAFYTPPQVARELVMIADVRPGMVCLEPSAGDGVIADALRETGAEVFCVEVNPPEAEKVRAKGFETQTGDFLAVPPEPRYDRVVMNPPFTRDQDADHVAHALRFLKPDGRLVAIVGKGFTFGQSKKRTAFRELIAERGGIVKELPEGTFRASGTMVATVVIELSGSVG